MPSKVPPGFIEVVDVSIPGDNDANKVVLRIRSKGETRHVILLSRSQVPGAIKLLKDALASTKATAKFGIGETVELEEWMEVKFQVH